MVLEKGDTIWLKKKHRNGEIWWEPLRVAGGYQTCAGGYMITEMAKHITMRHVRYLEKDDFLFEHEYVGMTLTS